MAPPIGGHAGASLEVVRRLMAREVPGVPNIEFNLVDVRDVAAAHLAALTRPEAVGHRHICVSERMSFHEIAAHLASHLGPAGYRIPTRRVPDWIVHCLALFSPTFRLVKTRLGPASHYDISGTRARLDWQPRPMLRSLIDTADSLRAQNIA